MKRENVHCFFRQLKALIIKNYLIKSRNKSDTILEFMFPVVLCLLIFGLNKYLDDRGEEDSLAFYKFNFVLTAAIPILLANTCRFILF